MKKKAMLTLSLAIILGSIILGSTFSAQAVSEWTLSIDGAVSNPTVLTISEIMAQPQSSVYGDIYCYGNFVTGGNWTGISLRSLFDTVEPDESAMSLRISASDGYSRDISMTEANRDDVIIAYELSGQPLTEVLRLVLPGSNGDRWVSMINHITIRTEPALSTQSAPTANFNTQPPLWRLPTPQPFPTSQPTPTPQPSPTTQPQQTPSPASPSPAPTTDSSPEPYPTVWVVSGVGLGAFAGTGLAVGWKKRKK
jgi:DMSO/TMAO reductase YedYZ molybdopterin-dependent catalytic subunit